MNTDIIWFKSVFQMVFTQAANIAPKRNVQWQRTSIGIRKNKNSSESNEEENTNMEQNFTI